MVPYILGPILLCLAHVLVADGFLVVAVVVVVVVALVWPGAAAGGADDAPEPLQLRRQTSDLRERVTGMLFGSSQSGPLGALQEHLFGLIGHELKQETVRRIGAQSWRSGKGAGVEESKGDAGEKESKTAEAAKPKAGTTKGRGDIPLCVWLCTGKQLVVGAVDCPCILAAATSRICSTSHFFE